MAEEKLFLAFFRPLILLMLSSPPFPPLTPSLSHLGRERAEKRRVQPDWADFYAETTLASVGAVALLPLMNFGLIT